MWISRNSEKWYFASSEIKLLCIESCLQKALDFHHLLSIQLCSVTSIKLLWWKQAKKWDAISSPCYRSVGDIQTDKVQIPGGGVLRSTSFFVWRHPHVQFRSAFHSTWNITRSTPRPVCTRPWWVFRVKTDLLRHSLEDVR